MFELDGDPGERSDLVGVRDSELARMSALLDTWAGLVGR
jgi:hypothetical protein